MLLREIHKTKQLTDTLKFITYFSYSTGKTLALSIDQKRGLIKILKRHFQVCLSYDHPLPPSPQTQMLAKLHVNGDWSRNYAGVNAMLWLVFKIFSTRLPVDFDWLKHNSINLIGNDTWHRAEVNLASICTSLSVLSLFFCVREEVRYLRVSRGTLWYIIRGSQFAKKNHKMALCSITFFKFSNSMVNGLNPGVSVVCLVWSYGWE